MQFNPAVRVRTMAIDRFGNSYIEYDGEPLLFCYDPAGNFSYLCNFDIRFVQHVYFNPAYVYRPSAAPQILPTLSESAPEPPLAPPEPARAPTLVFDLGRRWQRLDDSAQPIRIKPARPALPPRPTTAGFTYIKARDELPALALPPCAKQRSSQKQRRAARKKAAPAAVPAPPRPSKFDAAIAEVAGMFPAPPPVPRRPSRERLVYNTHRYNLEVHRLTRADILAAVARFNLDPARQHSRQARPRDPRRSADDTETAPASEIDYLSRLFEGDLARRRACETQGVIVIARDSLSNVRLPVTHIGDRIILTIDPAAPRRVSCNWYEYTAITSLYVHCPRLRMWVFRILLRYIAARGYRASDSTMPDKPDRISRESIFWTSPGRVTHGYTLVTIILRSSGCYRAILIWGAVERARPSVSRQSIVTVTQSMIMETQSMLIMFNHALARLLGINIPSRYYEKYHLNSKPIAVSLFAMETEAYSMFSKMTIPTLMSAQLTMADHAYDIVRHAVDSTRMGPRCRTAVQDKLRGWQETFKLMCRGPIITAIDDEPEFLVAVHRLHARQLDRFAQSVREIAACRTSDDVAQRVREIDRILSWDTSIHGLIE